MLQWFEASQKTIEKRSVDLFTAGYGGIWVPPMSRSEDSNSVGYNVYDRFDLGQPNDPTLYGTTNGFKCDGQLHAQSRRDRSSST